MKVVSHPQGFHEVTTEFSGQQVKLVNVRAVGTLEMGEDMEGLFATEWVPELVSALLLAQRIADREKPWEPWEDSDD